MMKMKLKNPTDKSHIIEFDEAIETLTRLSLFTEDSGFDPLMSKLTRIINQEKRDKMRRS